METIYFKEKTEKRIDEYLKTIYPYLSKNTLFKTFRKKDIKVNGTRIQNNYLLKNNDKIDIYLSLKILNGENNLKIIYEDTNLVIVNKPQGLPVHQDEKSTTSLIDNVIKYYQNNDIVNPQLCHRLDRNTGGLVLIAKNNLIKDIILNHFDSIKKFYICYVYGKIKDSTACLEAYLKKDSKTSKVTIFKNYTKHSKKIITKYKLLEYNQEISKLEVELITGKTHQIRAHLSYIGYPILGDGKYGINSINKKYGLKYQSLWAYKLSFDFPKNCELYYLNSQTFKISPKNDNFNF